MDYSKAKSITDNIEASIEVDRITFDGKAIWPVLKYYLFFSLLKFNEGTGPADGHKRSKKATSEFKPTIFSKTRFHTVQIVKLMVLWVDHRIRLSRHKIKPEKNMMFVDVTDREYVDVIGGKSYSRYISPYVEFLERNEKLHFLNLWETSSNLNKAIQPHYFSSASYLGYKRIVNFYMRKIRGRSDKFQNLGLLLDFYKDASYRHILQLQDIERDLEEMMMYEQLWLAILKKTNIRLVFMECYCGNNSYYGLIAACKSLGVKTVDIQHGMSLDQTYAGWYKTPPGGYLFLPDYYWCWSRYDVAQVTSTRQGSQELKPVLGGNLWLAKYKNENIKSQDDKQIQDLIRKKNPKRTILVTLQHSMPVSDILVSAIRESPTDWLWLIRFHPLDSVDPAYRPSYIKALNPYPHVEYKLSTECNLYHLLPLISVHITHHSTSAIEAITFKVPTILLGIKFREIFKDFIKSGNFYVAETGQDILDLIRSGVSVNADTYNYFKLETDERVPADLLKYLSECAA